MWFAAFMRWFFLAFVVLALSGCTGEPERTSIEEVNVSARTVHAATVVLDVEAVVGAAATGEDWTLRVRAQDGRTGLLIASESRDLERAEGRAGAYVVSIEVPREPTVRLEVHLLRDNLVERSAHLRVQQLDLLAPDVQDVGVRVERTDLNVRGVADGRVDLGASMYLTNEGPAGSPALRAQVVVREVTTRLVTDEAWLDVDPVPPGATALARLDLDLPDEQAYTIETTLWRDAFVVGRHAESLEFGKNGTAVARSVDLVYDREDDRGHHDYGDEAEDAQSPGLPLLGLGAALAVAAVVVRRRQA